MSRQETEPTLEDVGSDSWIRVAIDSHQKFKFAAQEGHTVCMAEHAVGALIAGILAIATAVRENTAALTQQMEPEPADEEENPTGGFTALDQSEPGKTI